MDLSDGLYVQALITREILGPIRPKLFQITVIGSVGSVLGCTPTKLVPTVTGITSGASLATGSPITLAVTVVNNCGAPIYSAQVVATFSNGDAPIVLSALSNGNYTGTWIPRNVSAQVTVAFFASSPGQPSQTFTGTVQITVSVSTASATPPAVNAGGVVHAASFSELSAFAGWHLQYLWDESGRIDSFGCLPPASDESGRHCCICGRPSGADFLREPDPN